MQNNMILYICLNDGSDTRVTKEIITLNKKYDIFYLGIGKKSEVSFALKYTKNHKLINGNHKSVFTILNLIYKLLLLLLKKKFKKVYVVDEQLFFCLFPFLLNMNVILDIFDSYFLKLNLPENKLYLIKKVIYGLPKKIIVTDENRFNLLPKFAQKKAIVIPNVPNFFKHNEKNISNDYLTICYFGSLHKDRGTNFLENLMAHDDQLKVIAAGWINDDYTKSFIENPRVNYLGIRRQSDVNTILAKEGDYLLSIYPLKNTNNIYASPNKIYDAIQTKTPVIINKEIIVSSLVEKLNIGYVIENFQCIDYGILINELKDKKKTYSFDDELIHEYTWEKYESKILNL